MEPQKPKKAFRNLFSKTEPDTDYSPLKLDNYLIGDEIKNNSINLDEVKPSAQELKPPLLVNNKTESTVEDSVISKTSLSVIEDIPKPKKDYDETNKSISKIEKKDNTAPYSFVKIQYNLNHFKEERKIWKENDYIEFINRIDQAQTDAFFLKGKLVSEIKEKFYLNNKKGWILFCDETLNMNYTTANQYIRVSQEFDVTSHQRKDFGFEHFKALLPLSQEARKEIINHTPSNMSVKSLRDVVAKRLLTSSSNMQQENKPVTSRSIVETLQKLKSQLSRLKSVSLSQEEKWQLFGAFQNLSEEMNLLSHNFTSTVEAKNEVSMNN